MFAGVGVDSHSCSYRWISWCHGDVDVMVVLALDSGFSFFKVLIRYGLALYAILLGLELVHAHFT
jgi:hypothetical protein